MLDRLAHLGAAPPITGVVLAGGASRRMGRDKALLRVEGVPLAQRVTAVLSRACAEVVAASGDGARLAWLGVPQVADTPGLVGPLAGVVAALHRAAHPLAAVVAVDCPAPSADLLALLARHWRGEACVAPEDADGRPQVLHALWRTDVAAELRQLATAERSVIVAARTLGLRRLAPAVWRAVDPTGAFARNVNTPADLTAAHRPAGYWRTPSTNNGKGSGLRAVARRSSR